MSSPWPQHGMTRKRYNELFDDVKLLLTKDEISEGWYFSSEYDGLLVNRNWKGHELTDEEWGE